jgi:uncharacterized protein (TIGR03435 family)
LPVYRLVIAKGGLKMQKTLADEMRGVNAARGQITARGISIEALLLYLSAWSGRTVVDKTGLTGGYDMDLHWTPEGAGGTSQTSGTSLDSGPSFFTAVQEQLGLKLEPAKEPMNTIVIDHVEAPSAN